MPDKRGDLYQLLVQNGCCTFSNFVTLDKESLGELSFEKTVDSTTSRRVIKKFEVRALFQFQEFHRHLDALKLLNFSPLTYLPTSADEFNPFRFGKFQATPPPPTTTTNNMPIMMFQRGVKHDPTVFGTLKDDKTCDTWNLHSTAQANAQDVAEILNPKHLLWSNKSVEKDLFQLKQKYMYAGFADKIQTDFGKVIVRKYASSFDDQSVYSEILNHANKSMKANIQSV